MKTYIFSNYNKSNALGLLKKDKLIIVINFKGKKPKTFLLDVDGVLNDGQFYLFFKGKIGKIFGPDDNDR